VLPEGRSAKGRTGGRDNQATRPRAKKESSNKSRNPCQFRGLIVAFGCGVSSGLIQRGRVSIRFPEDPKTESDWD